MDRKKKKETTEPAAGTGELKWLDPANVKFLRHGATLRLTVEGKRSVLKVSVMPAFPLAYPDKHISIRDGANKEVGMIADLRQLSEENVRILEEELRRRYVIPVIKKIVAVKERFGTEEWTVETDRGPSCFTTRNARDSVHHLSPERMILTDVDNNRYEIPDMSGLDKTSRYHLLRHL